MSHNIYTGNGRLAERLARLVKSWCKCNKDLVPTLIDLWQDTTGLTIGSLRNGPKNVPCPVGRSAADCRRKGGTLT